MKAAYRSVFFVMLYSLLMPVAGVPAGFLVVNAFTETAVTGNAISDLLCGLLCGYVFYIIVQRALHHRKILHEYSNSHRH